MTILMALIGGIHAAEPIPAREPIKGEQRPVWWWDIWMDHVVVIEGTINWIDAQEPEIEIKFDPVVLRATIGDVDTKLLQQNKHFRLGRINVKRLLFASPGITTKDSAIAISHDLLFLLPVEQLVRGDRTVYREGAKNGSSGVFVFRYGSMLVKPSLVFEGQLPEDGMASADAVFKYRNRFDHQKFKKDGEQAVGGNRQERP